MEHLNQIQPQDLKHLLSTMSQLQRELEVPKALLFCILFQESRLDPLKNYNIKLPAKGLGQFTPGALQEINRTPSFYDSRTGAILRDLLAPYHLPLNFSLLKIPALNARAHALAAAYSRPSVNRSPSSLKHYIPLPAPIVSYYHAPTAIYASGIYLNNRYRQIKHALDLQRIKYNPEVLWLYAAVAYNKGSRSMFILLTRYYMSYGQQAVEELLNDPIKTRTLFDNESNLDETLKEVWNSKVRPGYVHELHQNMRSLSSCALRSEDS